MLTVSAGGPTALEFLTAASIVAAAFFVIFGARASASRKDLNDSVTALQGRLLADQDEIRVLKETVNSQAALITSQTQQVADLRASVRTLELVTTSREIIVAGFTALGVDPKLLAVSNSRQ